MDINVKLGCVEGIELPKLTTGLHAPKWAIAVNEGLVVRQKHQHGFFYARTLSQSTIVGERFRCTLLLTYIPMYPTGEERKV